MILAENLSEKELKRIRFLIGDAFVTNELFHELGAIEERRPLVLKYMAAYVDYVYEAKSLYMTEDGCGFIGLQYSEKAPILPQLKMLIRIFYCLPFKKLRKMLRHIGQIADTNQKYAKRPHIDVLMAAVVKSSQGKGYAKQLIMFAKKTAAKRNVPLLIDTDMKAYAEMYRHLGFKLYNSKTADNQVTRYSLIWKPENSSSK